MTESHVSIHLSLHRLTDLTLQAEIRKYYITFLLSLRFSHKLIKLYCRFYLTARMCVPSCSQNKPIHFDVYMWYLCTRSVVTAAPVSELVVCLPGSKGDWTILYRMWQDMAALCTENLLCLMSLYSRKLILLYYLAYSVLLVFSYLLFVQNVQMYKMYLYMLFVQNILKYSPTFIVYLLVTPEYGL